MLDYHPSDYTIKKTSTSKAFAKKSIVHFYYETKTNALYKRLTKVIQLLWWISLLNSRKWKKFFSNSKEIL